MLYRRKIILALLESLGGEVLPTDFQKYLFLLSQLQEHPSFEFVPYKFGCFSFSSYVDRRVMRESGLLSQKEDKWELATTGGFLKQVSESDQRAIQAIKNKFGNLRGNDLIHYVYLKYPYYATRSEIAATILSNEEYRFVMESAHGDSSRALFTIGYEGRSPEGFLNELIQRNVDVLCDVRRNAVSMKYGFSGKTLKKHCEDVGIRYVHIPDLGISSEKRKQVATKSEFENLFEEYATNIVNKQQSLVELIGYIYEYNRVALTCFERDATSCHRHKLVNALSEYEPNLPDVINI
jgi:Protein of unknown function, DUF488